MLASLMVRLHGEMNLSVYESLDDDDDAILSNQPVPAAQPATSIDTDELRQFRSQWQTYALHSLVKSLFSSHLQ